MEPNYVGANRRIDAMAVAWLFAQDCVFFNPDEITWGGTHHGIAGAQINAEKVDEIPTFMENAEMYYQGIGDLLMTLEQDEELIVPRSKIHPGLHDAIREGDLTGITLFNLQACARAFQFLGDENESVKRNMMQMAGFEALVDNPNAMACTYVIAVDQRLTRGIPGFYKLVRRMFEDMRDYNEIDLPYLLVFTAARNFDADQCLGYFEDSVEGAVSETVHIETNMEEWQAEHNAEGEEKADNRDGGMVAASVGEAVSQMESKEQETTADRFIVSNMPEIEKAKKKKMSGAAYVRMSESAAKELMEARQQACDAVIDDAASDEDNVVAMAREFGGFNDVVCHHLGCLADVVESQIELGVSKAVAEKMLMEAYEFSELVADRFTCGNDYLDFIANSKVPVARPPLYDEAVKRLDTMASSL